MTEKQAPAQAVDLDRVRATAVGISLLTGVLILTIKCSAWALTGSVVIFGDAMESVMHVFVTLIVWMFMRVSLRPPDRNHPYGHGRVEFFSVGFEGGVLCLTGIGIVIYAGLAWGRGQQPTSMNAGFTLIVVAAAINLALGLYLLRAAKISDSPLLQADGKHVLADVWTSVGTAIAALAIVLGAPPYTDAVAGLLVGLWIIFEAVKLLRRAVAGLMDEADPEVMQRIVDAINSVREPEWSHLHALRYRHNGNAYHVDFHLVVPGDWSVRRGHGISERLETAILDELSAQGSVLVHLDCKASDAGLEQAGDFTVEEAAWSTLPPELAVTD